MTDTTPNEFPPLASAKGHCPACDAAMADPRKSDNGHRWIYWSCERCGTTLAGDVSHAKLGGASAIVWVGDMSRAPLSQKQISD
jgi:hypothetical protein